METFLTRLLATDFFTPMTESLPRFWRRMMLSAESVPVTLRVPREKEREIPLRSRRGSRGSTTGPWPLVCIILPYKRMPGTPVRTLRLQYSMEKGGIEGSEVRIQKGSRKISQIEADFGQDGQEARCTENGDRIENGFDQSDLR